MGEGNISWFVNELFGRGKEEKRRRTKTGII